MQAAAEDLSQIYETAKQNDPQYRSAKAALNSAYESVKVSGGAFWPSLGVSADFTD